MDALTQMSIAFTEENHKALPRFILYLFHILWKRVCSPGAKGLKWRFFDQESEQAEFGLKL